MAGPIAEIYSELELEEREKFLEVAIGAVFSMPHGGCMHNFASRPLSDIPGLFFRMFKIPQNDRRRERTKGANRPT